MGNFQKQLSLLGNTATHRQSEAWPSPGPNRELGYLSREQPHKVLGLGLILQEHIQLAVMCPLLCQLRTQRSTL